MPETATSGCSPLPFDPQILRDLASATLEEMTGLMARLNPTHVSLAWRDPDGQHWCSIACTRDRLDAHRFLGTGQTPAQAYQSAAIAYLKGHDPDEARSPEPAPPAADKS